MARRASSRTSHSSLSVGTATHEAPQLDFLTSWLVVAKQGGQPKALAEPRPRVPRCPVNLRKREAKAKARRATELGPLNHAAVAALSL